MIDTEIQIVCAAADVPDDDQLQAWVAAALAGRRQAAELTVRIVDEVEAQRLNATYRGRDYATNVLSFAAELPAGVDLPVLGDLVICAGVVAAEAAEQGKSLHAHWAHMVVHGVLHLLGYDHMEDDEAAVMEAAERTVLAGLGIADPYAEGADAPPEPAAGPAR